MRRRYITGSLLFSILAATCSFTINAQELPKVFGKQLHPNSINTETGTIRCITTEYEEYLQNKDPKRATNAEFEEWISGKIQENRSERVAASANGTNEIITIPVVVHVIHNESIEGFNENISDEQVLSQITVLNQDYRRMIGTPGYNNNAVGADIEIEFCLAQVDPSGNATNGIDRVYYSQSSWSESQIENTLKPNTIWNPNNYFNIWVCNFGGDLSGVLGYAQFPSSSGLDGISSNGGSANTDGVTIHYEYFGSSDIYSGGNYLPPYDKGRTTTHEIGHSLGLIHIWGNTYNNNSCNFSDYCDDTPASSGPNGSCNVHYSCSNYDMIENYMDYTNDACMNIFTQDQKERMLAVLQNSPRRASLKNSTVCMALADSRDFELLNGINVYPNPAQNILNIGAAELPDNYVIYNNLGQTMVSTEVNSANDLTVNTASYSNGIYFIRINKGSQSKVLKFVKK